MRAQATPLPPETGHARALRERLRPVLADCLATLGARTPPDRLLTLRAYHAFLDPHEILRLAILLRKAGRLDDACFVLDEAAQRCAEVDAELFLEAVFVFKTAGRADAIERLLDRAASLTGDGLGDRILLARLAMAAKDSTAANELLATIGPDDERAETDPATLMHLAALAASAGILDRAAWLVTRARGFGAAGAPFVKRMIRTADDLGTNLRSIAADYEARGCVSTLHVPDAFYARLAAAAPRAPAARDDGLLIVVNSLAIGGSERNAIGMANEFHALGRFAWVKVGVVMSGAANPAFKSLLDPGVEIVELDRQGAADGDAVSGLDPAVRRAIAGITPAASSLTILQMAAALRRLRPRAVHAYTSDVRAIQLGAAGVATGTPVVMNPGGFTPLGRGRGADYQVNMRWMRSAYASLLSHPLVQMLNPSLAAALEYADWLDVDPAKFGVNYYGFDVDGFRAKPARVAELRRVHAIAEDDFVVGGVFRFDPVKRPELWLRAAATLAQARPEARFLLVGDGEMFEASRDLARTLGIEDRVVFAGRQLDPVNWYRLMSVYLQTSASEGLGNVLIEAQAAGVPVVVPPVGGMPETLIHDRSGWIAPDDRPETLAAILEALAADPERRRRAGRFARAFVKERFDRSAMVARGMRAYEQH